MNKITKVCVHHGELNIKDIYISPKGHTDCRICKTISRTKSQEKNIKKTSEFIGPFHLIKKCSVHGEVKNGDVLIRPDGTLFCKLCDRERSKQRRYLKDWETYSERTCARCKTIKPIDEFQDFDKKLTCAYCSICRRECSSNHDIKTRSHLKRKYGITVQDYDRTFKEQNGLCAICFQPETAINGNRYPASTKTIKRLSIDHNHQTGEVRKLLCHACNVTIGTAKENPALLRACAEYLERHN